jgi:hypothetical protein
MAPRRLHTGVATIERFMAVVYQVVPDAELAARHCTART